MLEIVNLNKTYLLKDQSVNALKNVTMRFRRNEFVSILGPSGCGKTTLLNLVGGLDRYTSGDLIIDGVSTKNFKDKDWDNYRNHRVGFVFQSYNLIPHQTVLENVELALTLSGIKKSERRRRAISVLEKVGLADKLKSKPNQLSGGQMQRVAIARALVNDPEIILADEPTGALDSKTSIQIMDLLKEVSKDRLVIMVTHNPELANEYSSRIIRLLDGELIEDSQPYTEKECKAEIEKHNKIKAEKKEEETHTQLGFKKTKNKKSMSFFTALFLSFKNLLSKKGRTILVSIAGSIGIFGIALILAVSSGMTAYINNMQSQSLSSYPVSVMYMSLDTSKVMGALSGGVDGSNSNKTDNDKIVTYDPSTLLMDLGQYNYLSKGFVSYVDDYYSSKKKQEMLNDYQFTYASDMHLIIKNDEYCTFYKLDEDGNVAEIPLPPKSVYVPVNSTMSASAMSGSISSTFFQELDKDYVLSMYDMLGTDAKYPEEYNEIALVLNKDTTSIYSLYGLGLAANTTSTNVELSQIIGKTYRLLDLDTYYDYNGVNGCVPYIDFDSIKIPNNLMEPTSDYYTKYLPNAQTMYEKEGIDLKITCVLKLKDDAAGSIFSDGLMYKKELSNVYQQKNKNSQTVKTILKKYFKTNAADTAFVLDDDSALDYADYTSDNYYQLVFDETKANINFDVSYEPNIQELGMLGDRYDGLFDFTSPADMKTTLKNKFNYDLSYSEIMQIYLQVYSASDIPLSASFYAKTFDAKDDVANMIAEYNKTTTNPILFADTSQMLTNLLKSLVNIISYVLIAFAAISLVVSSIMIAIITYTSVIERTKEIGVLRSVGASKKDVFWVFTAETVIIGLAAGLIGIAFAGLFSLFISIILGSLTGVSGLAILQIGPALALITISVMLTFIAGLIPSRIATKKDPVLALRSE